MATRDGFACIRRALAAWSSACALLGLASCSLDNDVGQRGSYTFVSQRDTVDSVALPLRYLLILEQDAISDATLVYVFAGELGAAELGLHDLRRVLANRGGFRIDFATERSSYLDPEALSELEEAAHLELEGGREVPLFELTSEALGPTGARRFLRTVDSRDFAVTAYFGVLESAASLGALRLHVDGQALGFTPSLTAPDLDFALQDEQLEVSYGEVPGADYLLVEPYQVIVERLDGPDTDAGSSGRADAGQGDAGLQDADAGEEEPPEPQRLEAMVTTTLAPGERYAPSGTLLTDVFGRGCWSLDKPLTVRVAQVSRRYLVRRGGDFAVIHQRIDAEVAPDELWHELVGDPDFAAYCEDYR